MEPKFDLWWPSMGHNICRFGIIDRKKCPISEGICRQNWSTRWCSGAILRSLFILLKSATTWSPHLVCPSCRTLDQGLSDDIWLIRLTSSMTSQNICYWLRFSDVFQGSAYANDHLRPKAWYENDRKNMTSLLKHKWLLMIKVLSMIIVLSMIKVVILVILYLVGELMGSW